MYHKSIHMLFVALLVFTVVPALAARVGRVEWLQEEDPIRGIQANILTSPDPDLHDVIGGYSKAYAQVYIFDLDLLEFFWAEVGYKLDGDLTSVEKYFEYRKNAPIYFPDYPIITYLEGSPGDTGTTHNYKVVQDSDTKVWTAYFDGNTYGNTSIGTTWEGDTIRYCGEVGGLYEEDVQLMGDSGHKTKFSNLQYKTGAWSTHWPYDEIYHNTLEWSREDDQSIPPTWFKIWDLDP